MTKSNNKKEIVIMIAAFILPVIIMLLVGVFGNFYPFGDTSILVADMKIQFVDYIGYMKQIFFGNDDFLYTFSKTFGGDMTGFAAYYLFNPFYLMLLFFPNSELPAGILFMLIIMSGFCGLSFHLLLNEVYESRFASLIFSTAYALMGYYVAYINCIHYFFSIILFPIVILGLYKTYKSEKISLIYVFAVAFDVMSNYYIGYMVLIFTAVFFVCMLITDIETIDDFKNKIRTILTVLFSTILGVMISAFSLLSVFLTIRGQKSTGLSLSLSRNFHLYEFFSGLYMNAFNGNISDGLPIIYCGIVPVIFILFFFLDKNIKIKEKASAAFLLLFMIMGFYIDALNVAWHGFAHPIGFPYRNSFLFSFIVLFYGYKGFLSFNKEFKVKYVNYILIIYAVYSLFLLIIRNKNVTLAQIAITSVFFVLSLIIIIMLKSGKKYIIPAIVGIIVLESMELTFNGLSSVNAYYHNNKDIYENTEEAFRSFVNEQQQIVEKLKALDDSFYRIDKLYRRDHNDAMLIGYNGLSHFSSCETDTSKRFMGKMGFRDNGLWAFYSQGSTAFAESFMGMKYMLSQYDETSKPYEMIFTHNDKYIYKNSYALPLVFGVNNKIEEIDMTNPNLFDIQNRLAGSFSKENINIYEETGLIERKLQNVEEVDGKLYRKINKDEEAYIEYNVTAKNTDFIFMYFDAPYIMNTTLYIDGNERAPLFDKYDWCIRELGYYNPGEKGKVKIVLNQDEIEIDNVYFYSENKDKLNSWYLKATENECTLNKKTSSHLYGKVDITPETEKLVFSIPYDKDWNIYLDGKKVKTEKVLDSLLAIDITQGSHEIELRYIPRGLVYGFIISIISIITTFCIKYVNLKSSTTRAKNYAKTL